MTENTESPGSPETTQPKEPKDTTPSQGSTDSKTGSQPRGRRWLIENVVSLGLALLIVFMIRSSVVEAFKIPSGSMIPTLLIGDHIFVNKFAYGFKIPFSDVFTDRPIYLIDRAPPKHGDIIVFKFPKDESYYYIKRVVGVPGDTVEVRNKVIYINGNMATRDLVTGQPADEIFKKLEDPRYSPSNLEVFNEKLDSATHLMMTDKSNFVGDNFGPITVPPDNLFVMGDNRDFSHDSRFWGYVPMRNVKGKAMVIWLSLWMNFSEGQFIFRPDRIGTVLK